MKKHMPILLTVGVFVLLFAWWVKTRMSVPFTGFDGHYACEEFGLPDKNYNVMRFQTEGNRVIMDALFKSQTHPVGRLEIQSSSLARLDMDTSLTHSPTLSLNPLAEHFIEGKSDRIEIVGRHEGKELYRFVCRRSAAPY